jgi:hypothetical protein
MRSADIIFGLTPKEVRTLAYLCAVKNDIRIPPSQAEKGMAGADRISNFLKRHRYFSEAARTDEFGETILRQIF